MSNDFVWIQTRDSSPTLWNNNIAEPFRSFRGAFTESWTVFVEPALKKLQGLGRCANIGEFGLGAGTNWVLLSTAARALSFDMRFSAIEKDLRSFEMGLERWRSVEETLISFLRVRGIEAKSGTIASLERPTVFPSLDTAIEASVSFDVWFHDPFGFSVNPEGYTEETLKKCRLLWGARALGLSYACNKPFQNELKKLPGVEPNVIDILNSDLKRSRLEFYVDETHKETRP